MKILHLQTLAATVVALQLLLSAAGPAAAQDCISGREAQQAVEDRRIISLDRATQAAGVDPNRIISRGAEVCDIGGRPYYRVNIMDDYGAKSIDLPAGGE